MITAELLAVGPDPGLDPEAVPAVGRALELGGVPLRAKHVVAAEEGLIGPILARAVAAGGLVVCLGEGERTPALRQALARILGARLVLSERALEALGAAHAARGQPMPRRDERLALVPQGAMVVVARAGGEPGLLVETGGARVAVLPEARLAALDILREHVFPSLALAGLAGVAVVRTLRLCDVAIGEVEPALAAAVEGRDGVEGHAREVEGEVWVRLCIRAPSPAGARAAFEGLEPALRAAFGPAWYGVDDETLEAVVGCLLRARGLTIALAESCTGGLVGHRLTEIPGSSAYVERGYVVYSNAAKQALLGVPEAVLARHGAVSAECAEAMAVGARERAGADLGVSITGIAGPDGGTPAKPVGLVFIGLCDDRGIASHRFRFDRDRAGNKALSATMALALVRRRLLARESAPGLSRGAGPPGREGGVDTEVPPDPSR